MTCSTLKPTKVGMETPLAVLVHHSPEIDHFTNPAAHARSHHTAQHQADNHAGHEFRNIVDEAVHQTDDLQGIKAGNGWDGNALGGLVVQIFGRLRDEQ